MLDAQPIVHELPANCVGETRPHPEATIEELVAQARLLSVQGKIPEAGEFCKQALRLEPDNADALHVAAALARETGCVDDAMRHLARALLRHPRHAGCRYLLGFLLCEQKSFQRAAIHLTVACEEMPENPRALLAYTNALMHSGQPVESLARCDELLRSSPDLQLAHYNRGTALAGLNRWAEALECFDRSIELDPQHADSYFNRGSVTIGPAIVTPHRAEELWLSAIGDLERAVALSPTDPRFFVVLASAYLQADRLAEAADCRARAAQLDPENADKHLTAQGMYLIQLGDWERGWPIHENREAVKNFRWDTPQWKGEPLDGKSILLYSEQGIGDHIQFFRFVKTVADLGARVSLRLPQITRGLLDGCGKYRAFDETGHYDFHSSLMSLPAVLKLRVDTVPAADGYLEAEPEKIAKWRTRLGPRQRLRIGLAWRGNSKHPNDHNRSMSLSDLRPLLDIDAEFICLQKILDDDDRELLGSLGTVAFHGESLRDLTDTAAVCSLMDLVISVDTCIAHLAGALAKPVWIMVTKPAEWRWMSSGEKTPWYSSARLFRQPRIGDWNSVVARVRDELRALR